MITFTTEIELDDISTTAIVPVGLIPSLQEKVLEIEVTAELSPYIPAFTTGLPENCYPAEGGEIKELDCTYTDPITGNTAEFNFYWLSDAAGQRIEELVYKEAENG